VIISGIEIGAVISDGTHTFTASQGHTSLDVTTGWDLSKLTITPGNSANFTLTATVIESDSDGQTSSASADLKVVTGTDWTHAGTVDNNANWQTAADWDEGVPNSALNAVFDSSVTTPSGPYSVTISPYATAEAHALTFNDADAILYDRGHLVVDSAATIDAGWIGVESADFDGAANAAATMTVDGPLTIHGGEIAVMGGVYFGSGSWPGGTLSVTGGIAVDGGKLVVEPGTNSNTGALANPGAVLNAGSINVETGGSVELHGVASVSGVIETTGGNLIIGSDTQFTGTHTITFGSSSNGGTVSFVDTTTQTYSAPDICGFGAGGAATPDVIDLTNFDPTKTTFAESISNGNLVLTATEGGATTTLTFDNYTGGLHFATDGSVGTDITASAQPSTFTVSPVSGVEGSAIALKIPPTVNDVTPTSITISGIPSDAVLANNNGTLTVTNGSITLTAAQLVGLTITPGDAGNINLSLLAIVADSQGYHTASASEAVTVSPLPPTVSWVAGSQVVDGVGSAALIALNVGAASLAGDNGHNTISSILINGIPVGTVLTSGTNSFTATAGHTTADVAGWDLTNLTVTPESAANFTLTATVTEADSDGQTSTASANLKIVTGTDWVDASGGNWESSPNWDNGKPSLSLGADIDSSIVKASADYTIKVQSGGNAQALAVNDSHATLADNSSLSITGALLVNAGTIDVGQGDTLQSGSTTVTGGLIDIENGGSGNQNDQGDNNDQGDGNSQSKGGVFTTGALVVDGGKVLIEAGNGNSAATLNASSIDVATGGTVELDGKVNASGPIEVDGGNLIVSSTAKFTGTSTLTFGASGGTITLVDNSDGSNVGASIKGFGPGNDAIDLRNADYFSGMDFSVNYDKSSNTTTVSVGGEKVSLVGDFSAMDFKAQSDGITNADGGTGTKLTWGLPANATITLSPSGPYYDYQYGGITVTVTLTDPFGNALQGVVVDPTYTPVGPYSGGQGVFNFFQKIFEETGQLGPETTDANGQATFTFNSEGTSGTFNVSMLLNGNETISRQIVINPGEAVNWRSSLTSKLQFAGAQETALLTLLTNDPNINPVAGDAIGWSSTGNGSFSPGNGSAADVTDASGTLIDTYSPGSNIAQSATITATLGPSSDGIHPNTLSTSVNFVTMDTWNNANGGNWSDATSWSGHVVPDATHAAWIGVNGTYTVHVDANETVYGLGSDATATLDVKAPLIVDGAGDSVLAGEVDIDQGGVLVAEHGEIDLNGKFVNNGLLQVQNGAVVDVAGNITGTGELFADGAKIIVNGDTAASQSIVIQGAGVVYLAKPEASQVTFQGPGMLALGAVPASGMTVHNFGLGDSIDLTNLAWSSSVTKSWNSTNNTLTISNGSTSETIHFAEAHSASDFALTADPLGTGGIDVSYVSSTLNWAYGNVATSTYMGNANFGIGGINNAGVAIVATDSTDYFYVNGHLVQLTGAPTDTRGGYGMLFDAGINDNQEIVVTGHQGGASNPQTYTGTYDASTNLFDGSGGTTAAYTGPGSLTTNAIFPGHFGQGLGINNSGEIVGYFEDRPGLVNFSRVITINGPPSPRPDGGSNYNPIGDQMHEYGIIYKPGVGYLTIDAGNTVQNTGMHAFTPSTGATSFANTTTGAGFHEGYVEWGQTPTDGVAFTVMTGINNNGVAVGWYMDGESVQHSFIFDTNTDSFATIPDLTLRLPYYPNWYTTDTVVTGINDQGIVVGYYTFASATAIPAYPQGYDPDYVYGFVYDSNTHTFLTTDFSAAGVGDHIALTGINDNGMVTGEIGGNIVTANVNPVVNIDDGGTLYQTTNTYETINFAGPTGELVLSAGFNGQITGFNGSDVIDLVGINYVEQANWYGHYLPTGVLHVSENSGGYYNLNFLNYSGGFAFTSDGHGGTLISDPALTGEVTVSNGELFDVTGPDNGTITFAGNAGSLQLDDPTTFTGTIKGFAGTDAAHSDKVDISGFDVASTVFTEKSVGGNLVVTATDGSNVATLTFDHIDGMLNFASDSHGGVMITNASASTAAEIGTVDSTVSEAGVDGTITAADPGTSATLTTSVTAMGANDLGELTVHPATSANGTVSVAFNFNPDQANLAAGQTVTQSYDIAVNEGASTILHQTVSVSIGGAGSDNFVFSPGVGADTILNFDATRDTIDLSHFTSIQTVRQLEAMTTTNAHGDAVIDLGNHDSITIAGVTAAQFQQVMQSTVHLH
jgi:hypothetical protein